MPTSAGWLGLTSRQRELDQGSYPLGVKISDRELAAVPLHRHGWDGEWTIPSSPLSHSHTLTQIKLVAQGPLLLLSNPVSSSMT